MMTSLQKSTKTGHKAILSYAMKGIVTALLVIMAACLFFNIGMGKISYAATENEPPIIVSVASGNWNAAASWNLNRSPQNSDRVIVKSDHVIIKNGEGNIVGYDGELIVNGELRLTNILLEMNSASKVAINEGGKITFTGNFGWLNRKSAINIAGWLGFFGITINTDQAGPIAYGDGADSLLPIELLSFDAGMTDENTVALRWSTSAEKGNDFFTIERSLDGKNFFVLDTIAGAGNSNKKVDYTYTDTHPASGYNYYRLKQTDFDGNFKYFDIAGVVNDKAQPQVAQVSISPNPFNQHFEVSFHATDNSIVHLKLMDMQGATIFNKSLEAEKGTNTFVYNDHRLQSGIYLLSIVQKGVPAKTFRMVKSLN